MKQHKNAELQLRADKIREWALRMAFRAGKGHVVPAFSMAELLAVLYFDLLKVDPANPKWEKRDRFILSKGHGCLAFYAALAERGFFATDILETFSQVDSPLGGHPDRFRSSGVEASTGSLGHGLSVGIGMAWTGKFTRDDYHVVVLMGDGETDEGSIWEAAMFASHYQLDNLVGIVDRNKIQMTDFTERVMSLEPLAEKWRSFGWDVREIDGHDLSQIRDSVSSAFSRHLNQPHLILANTVKGKGVSFMENRPEWHLRVPKADEMALALEEIHQRVNSLRREIDAAD